MHSHFYVSYQFNPFNSPGIGFGYTTFDTPRPLPLNKFVIDKFHFELVKANPGRQIVILNIIPLEN